MLNQKFQISRWEILNVYTIHKTKLIAPENIDEIRDTACEPDVPPVRPVKLNAYFEDVEEHRPIISLLPQPVNVVLLQEFYNHLLPGASAGDYEHDHDIVEISPMDIFMTDVVINPHFIGRSKPFAYDFYRPVLRTAMLKARPQSWYQTMYAFKNRNGDAPTLEGDINHDATADMVLERFVQRAVDPQKRHIFDQYLDNPIVPNSVSTLEWLEAQNPTQMAALRADDPPWMKELNSYEFMIKRNSKPVLQVVDQKKYPSLQTVVYHKKDINVIFGPMFREIMIRLQAVLNHKLQIFTGVSPAAFAARLTKLYPPSSLTARFSSKFLNLEIDMSKYDKSQNAMVLKTECMFYLLLGVPPFWVQLWYNAHLNTTIRDRYSWLKWRVPFQRKSGDASTFGGNTIVLMMIVLWFVDPADIDFALFAGDDSYVRGRIPLEVDFGEDGAAHAQMVDVDVILFPHKGGKNFCLS